MAKGDKPKLTWMKYLEALLLRNPGLRMIDDPEKLEYYRSDLNVDLPPLIRDLMLKSLPDLILQPTTQEHLLPSIFPFLERCLLHFSSQYRQPHRLNRAKDFIRPFPHAVNHQKVLVY